MNEASGENALDDECDSMDVEGRTTSIREDKEFDILPQNYMGRSTRKRRMMMMYHNSRFECEHQYTVHIKMRRISLLWSKNEHPILRMPHKILRSPPRLFLMVCPFPFRV